MINWDGLVATDSPGEVTFRLTAAEFETLAAPDESLVGKRFTLRGAGGVVQVAVDRVETSGDDLLVTFEAPRDWMLAQMVSDTPSPPGP